jgi:hypothetical protein
VLQALGGADEPHRRIEVRQHGTIERARESRRHDAQHRSGARERGAQIVGWIDVGWQREAGQEHVVLARGAHAFHQVGFVRPQPDALGARGQHDRQRGSPASGADDGNRAAHRFT